MNENMSNLELNGQLPRPQPESAPGNLTEEQLSGPFAPSAEILLPAPELGSQSPPPQDPMPPEMNIPLAQSQQQTDTGGTADASLTALPTADDSDLIEKEWVIKAKQIVEQTKDDPYQQNRQINKFKAGYIKKRYNKDVRISEE